MRAAAHQNRPRAIFFGPASTRPLRKKRFKSRRHFQLSVPHLSFYSRPLVGSFLPLQPAPLLAFRQFS
jgi:hypothetical protein